MANQSEIQPRPIAIHWMRRDLRLQDNRALLAALSEGNPVQVVFIFDRMILDRLENTRDRRVAFIHQELTKIDIQLRSFGGRLLVGYGNPMDVWREWIKAFQSNHIDVQSIHIGRDYEPYAQTRDRELADFFESSGVAFKGVKDHVIFEKSEVTKDDGNPYTVFTPYSKKWRSLLRISDYDEAPSLGGLNTSTILPSTAIDWPEIPSLESMGFSWSSASIETFPERTISKEILRNYGEHRDIPSIKGTSRLSVHLRFGTISIREALRCGLEHSEKWTTELIWRDFYQMIIYHFPHSANESFRRVYDTIPWVNDEQHFNAWCEGKTGYPLVDAGMRELVQTGFMHNRVRMVVASFLCKHLLTDWRWGERFFAEHLMDFDLASNAGGWQWAAGSGCDAAPYFRVFNPTAQLTKFDKDFKYVRQWVPEYGTSDYPDPIVDHAFARIRAIETYKSALKPS